MLLVWLAPSAWPALFGGIYEVPYTLFEIDAATANWRIHSIRSAAFIKGSYFIVSYLRHQYPLSPVLPVFGYWLVVFQIATLLICPNPCIEWILVFAFFVINIF